jgi:hypothetical protein
MEKKREMLIPQIRITPKSAAAREFARAIARASQFKFTMPYVVPGGTSYDA